MTSPPVGEKGLFSKHENTFIRKRLTAETNMAFSNRKH
jgi:hypothetical protein